MSVRKGGRGGEYSPKQLVLTIFIKSSLFEMQHCDEKKISPVSIAWDFHLEAPIELEKRQLPISPQIVWESHILTVRIIIRDFSVLSVSSYYSIADLDITKFLLQYIMILWVRSRWVLVGRPANKQWGSLSNTGEHDARIKIKVTPQPKTDCRDEICSDGSVWFKMVANAKKLPNGIFAMVLNLKICLDGH